MPSASTPTIRLERSRVQTAMPINGVQFLRFFAGHRRGFGHRIDGPDMNLRTKPLLPLDDLPGNALGHGFDAGRTSEDNLLGDLFQSVAEARHVNSHLLRVQIGKEVDVSIEEVFLPFARDAEDALKPGDTCPAQADGDVRYRLLHVSLQANLQIERCRGHTGFVRMLEEFGDGQFQHRVHDISGDLSQ